VNALNFAALYEKTCYPGLLWLRSEPPTSTAAPDVHSWYAPKLKAEAASVPFPVPLTVLAPPKSKKSLPSSESRERNAASLSILRLVNLLDGNGDGEKEDDYGSIIPSMFAFETAVGFVRGAIKILGEDVVSSPVVDSQGGIRVTWKRGGRQVKLVCPATKEGSLYIYQSSAGGNSVQDQNVTAEALAARLSVLIGREPAAAG
jgi:hypothetical protein